jgi:hypothetical protein
MLSSGRQRDDSTSIGNFFRFKSDEPCYRNVIRLRVSHKSSLMHRSRGIAATYATDWSLYTTLAQNK